MNKPHTPRNAVTQTRREALVDAATYIVREQGFGAATVKAITARAGMSAGLLYSYAKNADELLGEVFRRAAGAELAVVDVAVSTLAADGASAEAQLIELVDTFAERALRGRSLAWALLVEPVGAVVEAERQVYRRGYAELLAEIVTTGIRTGEFAEQDPRLTSAGLVGAISEALAGPLSPFQERAAGGSGAVAAIRDLCLRAVGANSTERNPL